MSGLEYTVASSPFFREGLPHHCIFMFIHAPRVLG